MILPTGLRLQLLGLAAATMAAGLLIIIPADPVLKLAVLAVISAGTGFVLVRNKGRKSVGEAPAETAVQQESAEVASEPEPPAVLSEEPAFAEETLAGVETESERAFSAFLSRWETFKTQNADRALSGSPAQTPGHDLSEIKAGADFIADNILRAFEISDNLANTAKTAFELSESVQKGVTIVTGALTEALTQTGILFDQSKQISKIIEIMSEVSEKIHILSINASIVSARAGTAGKGFEVVAKEIRSLARETERSLEEIEQVIEDVQTTINSVVAKVGTASRQTNNEQQNLISVAGSLQGVILGVEIIRAVTSVAKEKAEEQQASMAQWNLAEQTSAPADQPGDAADIINQLDEDLKTLQTIIKERS